jgi:hypothetical protein
MLSLNPLTRNLMKVCQPPILIFTTRQRKLQYPRLPLKCRPEDRQLQQLYFSQKSLSLPHIRDLFLIFAHQPNLLPLLPLLHHPYHPSLLRGPTLLCHMLAHPGSACWMNLESIAIASSNRTRLTHQNVGDESFATQDWQERSML